MSLYPKQLQYFTETTGFRTSPGETVVYANALVPGTDITVNDVIVAISETIYGVDLSGITHNIRTRDRFRAFKDDFGSVVVFPNGVAIVGDQVVNELIAVLRVLWATRHDRGTKASPTTGYATASLT